MESIPQGINEFLRKTAGHPEAVPGATWDAVKGLGQGIAGITSPGIAYRLKKGEDPANITGDAATTMLPGSEEGVRGVAERLEPDRSFGVHDAAKAITDAVNPPPKAMVNYETTLSEHMPKVVDYAKRNGIKIVDRDTLAKAIKGTHDELKADYDKTYIEPTKDVQVPTQNIKGYSGGTVDYNTATVAQLNARLTEINATLSPSYEKGGMSAQSAISAESKSALNAEASAIRKSLNETVGKKLGIDPKQVGDARSALGSLRNAADKTQSSLNQARYIKNQNARGIDLPTSKSGLLHDIGRRLTAKNPDSAIAKTFERLQTEPQQAPVQPSPPQPA